jgi:hypothetical protein
VSLPPGPEPAWRTLVELWRKACYDSIVLRHLGEQLSVDREAFLRCAGSVADREEYDATKAEIAKAAAIERQRIGTAIKAAASRREIIAFGRRSPDAAEEPIKPHYWDFLDFDDPERNVVSCAGLYFAGVRFAKWADLSPAWRAYVLASPQQEGPFPAESHAEDGLPAKQEAVGMAIESILDRHPEFDHLGLNEAARAVAKKGFKYNTARAIVSRRRKSSKTSRVR